MPICPPTQSRGLCARPLPRTVLAICAVGNEVRLQQRLQQAIYCNATGSMRRPASRTDCILSARTFGMPATQGGGWRTGQCQQYIIMPAKQQSSKADDAEHAPMVCSDARGGGADCISFFVLTIFRSKQKRASGREREKRETCVGSTLCAVALCCF